MTRGTLLLGIAALTGCSSLDNCPDALPPIDIETGVTDSQALSYESAPWSGPLDAFPAKTELRFVHELGTTPELVVSYLSFSSQGAGVGSENGDVSENAGNQGRIDCVDARVAVIKNDTCEKDFFIRVVAIASGSGSTDQHCQP